MSPFAQDMAGAMSGAITTPIVSTLVIIILIQLYMCSVLGKIAKSLSKS